MKSSITFILLASTTAVCASTSDCDILLAPRWDNLEKNNMQEKQLGGKWVLVGSITFHKTSTLSAKLGRISLQWRGDHIDHLSGSLFKKPSDKNFMPIEDNLLCDGSWNKRNQCLTLDFCNKKQTLGALNIFYLVLTVPPSIELTLQSGHFNLVQTNLPDTFYKNNPGLKLDLAQLHSPRMIAT